MKDLFTSYDSKFTIKTALLITAVPAIMLLLVSYSVWLLLSLNFSYFLASGIPLDEHNVDVFMDYLLQTQADNLPLLGLFFIVVFFIGIFVSHIILRPFNELTSMCEELLSSTDDRIKIVGLERSKLLIKLGNFICSYYHAKKNGRSISVPDELLNVKKPTMDYVFYFQFFCLMFILMSIAIGSLVLFAEHLHASIIETAITVLRAPKGMSKFLASQHNVFQLIVLVPSFLGVILYVFIAQVIISKIQGVTFGYVRDICEVAKGNTLRRLSPRKNDPGRKSASAINDVLDILHPSMVLETKEEVQAQAIIPTKLPI